MPVFWGRLDSPSPKLVLRTREYSRILANLRSRGEGENYYPFFVSFKIVSHFGPVLRKCEASFCDSYTFFAALLTSFFFVTSARPFAGTCGNSALCVNRFFAGLAVAGPLFRWSFEADYLQYIDG